VTTVDFDLWKTTLSAQTKNKFLLYDDLNHVFFKGNRKATPAEYEKLGNMDLQPILDLAKWVKEN
jgi:hypothetical protein